MYYQICKRCEFRDRAKINIKGAFVEMYWISFLFCIFNETVPNMLSLTSGIMLSVYAIVLIATSGMLEFGLAKTYYDRTAQKEIKVSNIFAGINHFGKATGLYLYKTLFIFLWGLLFIVPGIIAMYRYSQVFYVYYENPDYTIRECMNKSKEMMKENKGFLFTLDLTFIGWYLLYFLFVCVVGTIVMFATENDSYYMLSMIMTMMVAKPPLENYRKQARAEYYIELNRCKKENWDTHDQMVAEDSNR